MVVVVPIALGAPPMLVFIPPAVTAAPAIFTSFVKVATRVVRLTAVAAVVLDGLVQPMVGPRNAPLAIVVISAQARRAGEQQKSRERGTRQHGFPQPK